MPSRSPNSRIEALESRCVPARLVGGPLPSEFGADLSTVDALPRDMELSQPVIIGTIDPLPEYYSPWLLSGAVIKSGAGELHLAQAAPQTWDGSGYISGGTLLVTSGATLNAGTFYMYGATLSFGSSSEVASVTVSTLSAGTLRLGARLGTSYLAFGHPAPPIVLPADISLPIAEGTLLSVNLSPETPASLIAPFGGRTPTITAA